MTVNPTHTALWPAPHASGAVDATVHVPGSKSVTNRALVLAALASEPGWLRRPLRSRDTLLMAGALRAMGVEIEEGVGPDGTGEFWRVIPARPARPGHGRRRQRRHGHALPSAGRHARRRRHPLRRRPAFVRAPAARRDRRAARAGCPHRRRRARRAADDRAGQRRPGGRPRRDRRVVVLAVRQRPAAVRPALQPGCRGPPHRFRAAVHAAHPHDRRHAALGRRPGRHPGVRRRAERLAGHAGRAARPRPDDRAGPVQRPAVPGGGAGDRRQGRGPRLAVPHHPARRPAPRDLHRDGRFLRTDRLRVGLHRIGCRARHRRRPRRGRRTDPGHRRRRRPSRTPRPRCAGWRTCACTRRTAWPRSPRRSTNSAATSPRPPTACTSARAGCTAGSSTPTRTTAWLPPARSSASRVEGVQIENVATTAKTLPEFPDLWTGMLGA